MTEDRLSILEAQQALLTQALQAALEGRWTGEPPSVEAYLYAIDPVLQGQVTPDPPVLESQPT